MKRHRNKGLKRNILIAGAATLIVLLSGSYFYVFVAGAPQLDAPQAERQTGLSFQVRSFVSPAMGEVRNYGVVLPPEYEQHVEERYPVIVLLHGGHGDERDFEDKAALTSVLHDLYKSHKIPASIVITPDGNDHRGSSPLWDSQYYDGANGKVATLIGEDLVQEVKSRYRTLEQPQFWAIGGLSSGGWGAFNIGLKHLNQFNTLFSHTGYFVDSSGSENSPQFFVQQISLDKRKRLRVYLDAGKSDHKYLEATQSFHQTLDRLGIANQFRVFEGGHGIVGKNSGWNYWHKHLADSLSYVGQQFRIALKQKNQGAGETLHNAKQKKDGKLE